MARCSECDFKSMYNVSPKPEEDLGDVCDRCGDSIKISEVLYPVTRLLAEDWEDGPGLRETQEALRKLLEMMRNGTIKIEVDLEKAQENG